MSNFKVGDWVRIKGTLESDIFKLTENEIKYKEIILGHFIFEENTWTHWQPKEGEWCWFDKNKLGKFWKKQGTRNYWTLSDFISISEKTRIPSGDYFVSDYCEPFIGQLPSFIKDKQ